MLSQGLSEAGFSVTVLGHSLGAGAAALLSVILKDRCASWKHYIWILPLLHHACGAHPAHKRPLFPSMFKFERPTEAISAGE